MDVSQFDFDLPEDADRPAPGRAAGCRAAAGRPSRRFARTCPYCAICRAFSQPATGWWSTIPRSFRRALRGRRAAAPRRRRRRARRSRSRCTAASAPDRFRAFAKPARKLAAGDRVALGAGPRGRRHGARRRRRGRIALRSFRARSSMRRLRREGEVPLPPYIAGKRKPDAQDPSRLSDRLRARCRVGRRADGRAALHAGSACRARREGRQPRDRDAACGGRAPSCP